MSSAPSTEEIARDARWLAQAFEPATGLVRWIAMGRDAYRAASFLDDRILHTPVTAVTRPLEDIAAALPGDARSDAGWIFHIGHVGSTLVSRLLGELDGVLAIREPRILRDIAALPAEQRGAIVPAVRKLLSRTFARNETALVKATSFVSEIAAELVPPGGRALFLYTDPRTYIASILAGENSLKELAALAGSRMRRVATRVPGLSTGDSAAQAAAAAWACEMTALEAVAESTADRNILWLHFDRMLDGMGPELVRTAAFFGFEAPPERIEAIVRGPLMSRYSKAPEYEYSPTLRRELIDQEIGLQGDDIDAALAGLRASASSSPLLSRALARA